MSFRLLHEERGYASEAWSNKQLARLEANWQKVVVRSAPTLDRRQGLLGRLNGRDREVLGLRLGLGLAEGLDLPTIASRLGLTRTQVEGSLRRAADQAQGGMPLAS